MQNTQLLRVCQSVKFQEISSYAVYGAKARERKKENSK